jgi:nucleotide-binding universal stress UspA family protein
VPEEEPKSPSTPGRSALTARHRRQDARPQEVNFMFKHVLVAIDGSAYTEVAMPTAIDVTKKFGADLLVLHIAEHDRGRSVAYKVESPAEAMKLIGDAVKTAHDAGVVAKGQLRDVAVGHVAKTIVETATANEIDLIVMGSRGLSDIQGLLLGSVTHKVIQLAHVPVLVTRGPIPVKAEAKQPALTAVIATATA